MPVGYGNMGIPANKGLRTVQGQSAKSIAKHHAWHRTTGRCGLDYYLVGSNYRWDNLVPELEVPDQA